MRVGLFNNSLFIEIGQTLLRVLYGEESLELPLERQANGRLSPACKDRVTSALETFLKKRNWQPRLRAICAIDARGVSLRRVSLPANGRQDLHNVLRLQIESEFPIPPDELAWGFVQGEAAPGQPQNGKRELSVVAVRKEILDEYAHLLAACGVNPVFTLAAMARSWSVPGATGSFALLDIGNRHSELMAFENGAPMCLRILDWGAEQITREIEGSPETSAENAEKLGLQREDAGSGDGGAGHKIRASMRSALDTLAESINEVWKGQRVYLTGNPIVCRDLLQELAERLPAGTRCEGIGPAAAKHESAAIVGLQSSSRMNGGEPPLIIRLQETRLGDLSKKTGNQGVIPVWVARCREMIGQPETGKWARLMAILVATALAVPFVEPLVMKPIFAHQLAAIKAEKGRLAIIDRELSFLQYLKQNQTPYLDTLTIIACSVGPGSRFDSISMSRTGELGLKGSLKDSTQVSDFRSKLIKSGFFSNVTVEDQTPTPDRQKMIVRMTAQLKPLAARGTVSVDTILSNAPPVSAGSGGFGGFGGPGMFPGGMPMPSMPMPMPGPKPGSSSPEGGKPPGQNLEKGKATRTIKVGDATVEVPPNSGPVIPPRQP